MTDHLLSVRGVQLCAESFGERRDPPVLLVMGTGASMLWWDEGFCRGLAAGGRFVIRYDHRDTGRSVCYEPGQPGYEAGDLAEDIVGLLDAFDMSAAHLVGVSAGAAMAQLVALDHPDRLLSLTLISTTFAESTGRELPGPTERFAQFVQAGTPDWNDRNALIDYLAQYAVVLSGGRRPFSESEVRQLLEAEADRATNRASAQNHDLLKDTHRERPSISSIGAPTLVVHGS